MFGADSGHDQMGHLAWLLFLCAKMAWGEPLSLSVARLRFVRDRGEILCLGPLKGPKIPCLQSIEGVRQVVGHQ